MRKLDSNNKSLAWIEVYRWAISGAAIAVPNDDKLLPAAVHSHACYFADQAVDALEQRWRMWREQEDANEE